MTDDPIVDAGERAFRLAEEYGVDGQWASELVQRIIRNGGSVREAHGYLEDRIFRVRRADAGLADKHRRLVSWTEPPEAWRWAESDRRIRENSAAVARRVRRHRGQSTS